ncbi:putative RNA-directed DNA polymerase [Tanacetum coccineum]
MDLCGPMRVASVNGKKYILVIVDDYSRFTWVKCLRSKDEAPAFIINFLKMIQVRLKETVCRIRTDNGTEFVNQTLREYYEKVGISHETSVARSPQQNGVVERRNRTLIEAARTMLIYAKAPLFLWAEAVATACYTQNRSMIRRHYGKTPYELLHDKPPDLSYLHVFGALCYPTNDSENLGKLQPKADIGIFIGYAPTKKAFRIYNRRTRRIIETIQTEASFRHVQGTTSRDLWLSLKKAYAPHSTSREYTLKTQLLRIKMHGDETPDAYLNRAQEYADALAAIGEPVKDKDLVMLVVSGLREEYNGLKTTITARQSPTAFSELHALLSDHDYMLGKTRTPIAPYGPQAFYGARPSNNNRSNNNNNRGNRNNSRGNNNRGRDNGRQFDWASTQNTVYGTCNRCGIGHIPSQCPNRDPSTIRTRPSANFANTRAQSSNASANWHSDTGANSHVTPDLEAMDNSEAYYGDDALHVGNGKGLPILHIGSSKVYSPQKTFSLKNILHVPEISHNLLSVQKFCHDNDVFFEFHTSYFVVKDESTHTTLLTGPSKHGLYTITLPQLKSINKVSFSAVRASPTIWHRRLGHPHQRLLHSMLSNFSLPVTNKSLSSFCNSCPLGKSSKLPLFESGFRSNNIYHFVREKVAQGDLRVQHISKHDQITDIFTKTLPTPRSLFLRSKLQVIARP